MLKQRTNSLKVKLPKENEEGTGVSLEREFINEIIERNIDKVCQGKKDKKVRTLQKIYLTYGLGSKEFYNQCYNYLTYLVLKYAWGYVNENNLEDLINECFVRVYESVDKYYDPEKGNLATFIFTVCRNKLSSNYKKEKKRAAKESYIDDSTKISLDNFEDTEKNQEGGYGNKRIEMFKDSMNIDLEMILRADTYLKFSEAQILEAKSEVLEKGKCDSLLFRDLYWSYQEKDINDIENSYYS